MKYKSFFKIFFNALLFMTSFLYFYITTLLVIGIAEYGSYSVCLYFNAFGEWVAEIPLFYLTGAYLIYLFAKNIVSGVQNEDLGDKAHG